MIRSQQQPNVPFLVKPDVEGPHLVFWAKLMVLIKHHLLKVLKAGRKLFTWHFNIRDGCCLPGQRNTDLHGVAEDGRDGAYSNWSGGKSQNIQYTEHYGWKTGSIDIMENKVVPLRTKQYILYSSPTGRRPCEAEVWVPSARRGGPGRPPDEGGVLGDAGADGGAARGERGQGEGALHHFRRLLYCALFNVKSMLGSRDLIMIMIMGLLCWPFPF